MGTETALSADTANAFDPNKIAAEVTTAVLIEAAKSGWKKVKKFFQDQDVKDSIDYGDAYSDYLQNTINKNSKIKTLIYRRVPKDLYSFYECVSVIYNNNKIDTSNAQNVLNISNKLIVTGTGGIGKSLLLKHLFLNVAQQGTYIPVLIELRKFNQLENKEISLYQAVYQTLSDNGLHLEDEYYSYSLNEGGYLILLDGLDEVNRSKLEKVSEEIRDFSSHYNKNHFVVSSRPTDHFIGWNDFHELSLCSLTKTQALHLIQKIEFDEAVKTPFYNALNKELFRKYESFASNPLLLTIMLLTFNNHASIPEKLNDFYEEAFATLFNMHDATKDCFVRDIRSHLGCEDFKMILAYICFKSYFKGDFEFSEPQLRTYIQKAKEKFSDKPFSIDDFKEDLTSSVCMLLKDGLNYRFIHRSFQEYFSAWYTCKLTDDIQSRLLTTWLSESNACSTDEYLDMLFDLQSDKVNKIIFCPGIKKLKALYDEYHFSYNLIQKIFRGITISIKNSNKNGQRQKIYRVGLSIGDPYLGHILQMACRLNEYPFPPNDLVDPKEQEILKKIVASTKHAMPYHWSFDEVFSIVSPDDLMYCLQWCNSHLQFCFDIYEKYSDSSALKKRKVSSIIDEL